MVHFNHAFASVNDFISNEAKMHQKMDPSTNCINTFTPTNVIRKLLIIYFGYHSYSKQEITDKVPQIKTVPLGKKLSSQVMGVYYLSDYWK